MVQEYDKVKLVTGEVARISEVLEEGVAYIADIFKKDGGISVEQIAYNDIASVFKEIEYPISRAV